MRMIWYVYVRVRAVMIINSACTQARNQVAISHQMLRAISSFMISLLPP
jgi:hypothetical protein